jgi:hypothetical protein
MCKSGGFSLRPFSSVVSATDNPLDLSCAGVLQPAQDRTLFYNKRSSAMNIFEMVLGFDDNDDDPRYGIVPEVSEDAPEDHTVILIDPALVERHGLALNTHGFPTSESLEAWHREHNPHLFND